MFEKQVEFRKIIGKGRDFIVDLMDEQGKGQLIYDHCQAIASEIQELINCVYWKKWATTPDNRFKFKNIENAKEEICDLFIFGLDICAALGMSPEDLATIIARKTDINIQRQLNKYSMDTKDGKDSAELWQQIKDGDFNKSKIIPSELSTEEINELVANDVDLQTKSLYVSEQPESVSIYRFAQVDLTESYGVTLKSTNETKIISFSNMEMATSSDPRGMLMRKISSEFNLTKPFQIIEA
jgi:hypothetical protein